MKDKTIVNINGQLFPPEQASISIFDRGFLYGDSVYEVTMLVDGVPFMIEAHLDRLERSAAKIMLPLSWSREEILKQIMISARHISCSKSYVRVICTRGEGEITLDPTKEQQGNIIIIAKELAPNPPNWYTDGVSMVIADILRNHKRATDPSVKSGNYLNNVLAMGEAKRAGAFDAIMLNHHGHVTEGTTSNIWIVENGKYITPPLEAGLLDGITRQTLLKMGLDQNLVMLEENIDAKRLKSADEVFLTSTTKEIVPIVKIDDTAIKAGKPGEYTKKLHAMYQKLMKDHFESEKKRLSF